jgi:hypothetical protein
MTEFVLSKNITDHPLPNGGPVELRKKTLDTVTVFRDGLKPDNSTNDQTVS